MSANVPLQGWGDWPRKERRMSVKRTKRKSSGMEAKEELAVERFWKRNGMVLNWDVEEGGLRIP